MEELPCPEMSLVIFPSPAALAAHLATVSACTTPAALVQALAASCPDPSWLSGEQGTGASLVAALSGLGACSPQLARFPFFGAGGLLSSICARAARLHALLPAGLPLLAAAPSEVALPRRAAAALVACMFLCIVPPQNRPGLEFNASHFAVVMGLPLQHTAEKIRMVLHYFARLQEEEGEEEGGGAAAVAVAAVEAAEAAV